MDVKALVMVRAMDVMAAHHVLVAVQVVHRVKVVVMDVLAHVKVDVPENVLVIVLHVLAFVKMIMTVIVKY
jgi:hypothetical protein